MSKISSTGSKVDVPHCDWWILIHFEGFCFSQSVDRGSEGHILCYDGWIWIHFVIVGFRFHGPLIADVQTFKL